VDAGTGDVERDIRLIRTLRTIGGLHEFMPIHPYSPRLRIALLWISSLAALAGILTGYWLSLPVSWQKRAARWGRRPEAPGPS
jgi:hypothetical protein